MGVYAGIGSRRAPANVLTLANLAGRELADRGWTLRSGHAPGMDQAFEQGAGERAEAFLPWSSFEQKIPLRAGVVQQAPSDLAYRIAARFHPAWELLSRGSAALHARNVHQVLGADCVSPVQFVLCWTPGGGPHGGTGQAMRIAKAHDIPVFNLWEDNARLRVETMLATR
jgi:hypothetical protein